MSTHYIIGIDEAGRGAWAGPIVAGGFMIEKDRFTTLGETIPGIQDSKKLPKKEREAIYSTIEYLSHKSECQYTFSYRDADVIDAVGIREANRSCMEDIILSFLQYIHEDDTVEIWIDGCDNYTFSVDDFEYFFAKKKTRKSSIRDDERLIVSRKNNLPESRKEEIAGKTDENFIPKKWISFLIHGDNLHRAISLGGIIAKVIRDRMMCEYSEDFPLYGFDSHVGYGTRKHQEAMNNYTITPIHRKSYAPVKRLISPPSSI